MVEEISNEFKSIKPEKKVKVRYPLFVKKNAANMYE